MFLLVKSQTERSQLGNKEEVIRKINTLVNHAVIKPKKRKPTKPSKAAKEKRIESKKKKGEINQYQYDGKMYNQGMHAAEYLQPGRHG